MLVTLCFTINSPNSVLLGVLNAFLRRPPWYWMVCPPSRVLSPFVSHCTPFLVSLCWMVRPPSLVRLPLYPFFFFPFVGWCVRLSEGLGLPLYPLFPCFHLMDGASALQRVNCLLCLPLYPFLFPFVGWCVRLPAGLVSLCLPLYPFSCFPVLHGELAFPRVLSPFVSHCTPSCFPVLDGELAFPRVLSPLSPIVPLLVSLWWMVCPPWQGSCLPLSPSSPFLVFFLCWTLCPP